MRKILLILLIILGLGASSTAQNTIRYGYCPENLSQEDGLAQGTGKNKFVAAMICLDPASDPVMKRLKGHQIKGVRCYLREEYRQASQKRSYVMAAIGDPNSPLEKKMHNFEKGWNEVYFDEPISITDERLFIGFQVFEKVGTPYPLLTDGRVSVPGGCWINLDRKGWKEMKDRGTFMIQAILDDSSVTELSNCAYAQLSDFPLVVVPKKMFDAKVYIKNFSDTAINTIELKTIGSGDEKAHLQKVKFEPALAPYDGRVLDLQIRAGKKVGISEEIQLSVPQVNDQVAQTASDGKSFLYVTLDAFLRIPIVEEFTSQLCPNCPFMMYYVEKAREAYKEPLLYVTHHTGYQNDAFTLKNEDQLLYLFGEVDTFNPAIMYDRLYFPSESSVILSSSGETSHTPYLEKFNEIAQRPAMAEVIVEVNKIEDEISCQVHGRVNLEMATSGKPLYITTYLVEDGLQLDKYGQQGLDVEDGPEDLVSGFRHNGIIRQSLSKQVTGDVLQLNNKGEFNVKYKTTFNPSWEWKNCQVISFIHKYNPQNLSENYVLNAGSNRYNHLITGIEDIYNNEDPELNIYIDKDRKIETNIPVQKLNIYNINGTQQNINMPLTSGLYIIQAIMKNDHVVTKKILVK